MYPISVRGSTIWEDLHALEAFRLIEIEGVTPISALPAPGVGAPTVLTAAAAAGTASGTLPQTDRGTDEKRKKTDDLVLSFRDLVVHQVRDSIIESYCSRFDTGFRPQRRTSSLIRPAVFYLKIHVEAISGQRLASLKTSDKTRN